jgi:hypothetical protein
MPKVRPSGHHNRSRSPIRFHLALNLSATMDRVLKDRSRQLTLPPADGPKDGSQTTADVDAHMEIQPPLPQPTLSQLRR